MAEVIITIKDTEAGTVDVTTDFAPYLREGDAMTNAQYVASVAFAAIERTMKKE